MCLILFCLFKNDLTNSFIYNLDLDHCKNITNISALRNVHNLNLSHCTRIKDFSALRNVQRLTINNFT
jgi:hypothetical protein